MMKRTLQLFWAVLREIFDEAAYDRYLKQQGTRRSTTSYADFLAFIRERRERRARCC